MTFPLRLENRGRFGRTLSNAALVASAATTSLIAGAAITQKPSLNRLELAISITAALLLAALHRPHAALVGLFLALPFLAIVRRLLIASSGWSTHDPLLLGAPVFAVALLVALFVIEGRPLAPDRLSRLVLALLAVTLFEAANPSSGGLAAGAASLLFAGAPLLWFFLGREFGNRTTVARILVCIVLLALPIALYGYYQTSSGLPSWDAAWVQTTGYAALTVGGTIRAFGTFSSAAEYALYLGMAIVICLAAAFHRRVIALIPIPFLAVALFLESSRGILVVGFAAGLLLLGMRIGNTRAMLAVLVSGFLLMTLALQHYRHALEATATQSHNPLVMHQVGGLLNPLDSNQSTLGLKWHGLVGGIRAGFTNPLGSGIAATTLGGQRFGARAATVENDFGNAFVGLGLAGGLLFLAIVVLTLKWGIELYRIERSFATYATVGVLVVLVGQWLNGGLYAVCPIVWFLMGWVARQRMQHTGHQTPASS
jgi:hypothetical protein